MPVTRPRGGDGRVEYVVVKRTEDLDDDGDVDDLDRAIEKAMGSATTTARQSRPTGGDDDDDDKPPPPPIRVTMTMTLPKSQATGTALADQNPTETVVVTIPPPPPPPKPHHNGGISQTTEHLLIAAGSIGATIIVVMVLFAIHTMRKKGVTFAEAVKRGKYRATRRGPPPPPKQSWDSKAPYTQDYGSIRGGTITPPPAVMARSGSTSSQRPLIAQRNNSFNQHPSPVLDTSPEPAQSFYLDSSPRRNNTINSHRRNDSETPSSPVLPLQTQRRSQSTRNTRSISAASELQYPEPPQERSLSPLPPPPTFRQFLFNRKSISARPGFGPGGMVSRFSWTNSNAPQTPHDPNRDTMGPIGRDSYMTQRSSIPRFRTVDSWVDQQANRLEQQKLREQLRFTQSSYATDDERDAVPEVPMLPRNVEELRDGGNNLDNNPFPTRSPPPPANGLPGKNIKHERHDTNTTMETAPIFRQHPGNEVRISTRSLVPSEILNSKMKSSVL